MGRKIDRFGILLLATAGLFTLFIRVFRSIPAACLLTFLTCAALRKVFSFKKAKQKMSKGDALAILSQWAFEDKESTSSKIADLLNTEPDHPKLICIIRPISFGLSKSDVFSQWESHAGADSIVIAATCYADGQSIAFAETLRQPTVEIIDAGKLLPKIRKSDLQPPERRPIQEILRWVKTAAIALPSRLPWYRSLFFGLMMMILYLITGSLCYLILSIGSWFLAGTSLRVRKT